MAGFKNHYKTLELPYFADEAAVKAAYRKLVKQHHPDANGGDDSTFKEISDAYTILSDATKKAAFDAKLTIIVERAQQINPHKSAQQKGPAPSATTQPPPPKPPNTKQQHAQQNSQSQAPSSDVVDRFFHRFLKEPLRQHAPTSWPGHINSWLGGNKNTQSTSAGPQNGAAIRGEDVSVETTLPLHQATRGTTKTVHVKHKEPCPECLTSGLVNDKRCEPCLGEGYTIRKRSIEVKIPAGVQHGAKIRVSGEGGRSPNHGDSGDLYLLIQLSPPPNSSAKKEPNAANTPPTPKPPKQPDPPKHAKPKKETSPPPTPTTAPPQQGPPPGDTSSPTDKELDTHSELAISCWDMLLGLETHTTTHQGKAPLTIPPLTQPGQRLCIANMGKRYGHHKGDHWVTITLTLPKSLTDEQKALIKLWQQR